MLSCVVWSSVWICLFVWLIVSLFARVLPVFWITLCFHIMALCIPQQWQNVTSIKNEIPTWFHSTIKTTRYLLWVAHQGEGRSLLSTNALLFTWQCITALVDSFSGAFSHVYMHLKVKLNRNFKLTAVYNIKKTLLQHYFMIYLLFTTRLIGTFLWTAHYVQCHPGRPVTQADFGEHFSLAYGHVASVTKADSGFCKSGIYPCNHNTFSNEDFLAAEATDRVDQPAIPSDPADVPVTSSPMATAPNTLPSEENRTVNTEHSSSVKTALVIPPSLVSSTPLVDTAV